MIMKFSYEITKRMIWKLLLEKTSIYVIEWSHGKLKFSGCLKSDEIRHIRHIIEQM